ncbi:MAG: ankyrin repeat domain-containing protein [Verrucomicrobiota bacterium]
MSQPWFMVGREYRRDGVPELVVDGDCWPEEAVNGDDAWALFCASADGDLDQVRRLIDGDPNLVHAQIWYAKPIDLAMREGHLEIMKVMLDVDKQRWFFDHTRDWCYRTTENEMQRRGFGELVEYLRSWKLRQAPNYRPEVDGFSECIRGVDSQSWKEVAMSNAKVIASVEADRALLRATDQRGLTVSHLALEAKNLVLLVALLERGAPLDVRTVRGWTPMDYAVDLFPAAIPLLLDRGARPTLQAMIACGYTDDLRSRLETDPSEINDRSFSEQTPLTQAARMQRADLVELLLEFGADPNRPQTKGPPLFIATPNWREEVMRLLQKAGVDPKDDLDSSGRSLRALVEGRKWGNHPAREAYDWLTEHGLIDPNNLDYAMLPQEIVQHVEPIHWLEGVESVENWAKQYGPERLIDLWWGLGPHSRPDRETMEALVRHGHDVNRTDWWGRTLLQAEAAEGNLDRAKVLLDLGADLHAIDVQSHTNALGYAARNGQVEMVRFFLEHGADKTPDVPVWAFPLTYAKNFLEDHETKYSETANGQSRLNGHRTNQAASAYEEIIGLLSL